MAKDICWFSESRQSRLDLLLIMVLTFRQCPGGGRKRITQSPALHTQSTRKSYDCSNCSPDLGVCQSPHTRYSLSGVYTMRSEVINLRGFYEMTEHVT